MEAFDPSMFPHLAILNVLNEGADATASTFEDFAPGVAPLPCRVRATATHQSPFGPGAGEVSTTDCRVGFPADPGCKKGDRFIRASDGLTVRALAPARARDGDGVLFVVYGLIVD